MIGSYQPCGQRRPPQCVYLVGYRCTGKTSIGRRLAQQLRRVFIDCDAQMRAAAGMTINDIVSREGWDGFRRRERRLLQEVCRTASGVVATGGGAVLSAANRWDMRRSGIVVWLTASAATIAARMADDPLSGTQRPALSHEPLEMELAKTLAARIPLYADAAHFRVFTDNRTIDGICEDILHRLPGGLRSGKRFAPRRSSAKSSFKLSSVQK